MSPPHPLTPSPPYPPPRPIHYGILAVGQAAVGSAAILARLGLGAGLTPVALAAWRLVVASALLAVALRVRRTVAGPPVGRRDFGLLLAAGILLGLHFAAWFASLQRISVAGSTLLVATTPLWAGLGDLLTRRRRQPAAFWLGLVVAAVGVWLVTAGLGEPVGPARHAGEAGSGDLLALAGSVAIAAYLLIVQPVQERLGSARLVAWTYSLSAVTLLPVAALSSGPALWPRTAPAWVSIAGMALGPQLIGHTAFNWSLHRFTAGAVAASTLTEPVFAALLAWWLLGEPLTVRQALGAVVLLAGVTMAVIRDRPAKS